MNKKTDNDEKLHNTNFIDSWGNAINGIIYGTTTQSNVRKQLLIIAIVMVVSLFFELSKIEFLCLIFSVVLIIVAEMINTAIETVVDLYTDLYHPKAKIAKDVAAGAVVITALNAVIIAYFLFFDKIGKMGTTVLEALVNSPQYLAFVAVIICIVSVVALKAAKQRGKIKKLVVSGQAVLSFAVVTAIWINTKNILIVALALIMAGMVVVNRVDCKQRTWLEVVLGAIIGVLITILIYGLAIIKI